MAFSDVLAARVRRVLSARNDVEEKKMFGGLAFMVGGHMCCGILADELMLRLGEAEAARALARAHVRPMDFTGRPMKGMVFVGAAATRTDPALVRWLALAVNCVLSLPPKSGKAAKVRKRRLRVTAR